MLKTLDTHSDMAKLVIDDCGNLLEIKREDFWANQIRKWLRSRVQEIVIELKNKARLDV